jgi:outer membrane protein TolC
MEFAQTVPMDENLLIQQALAHRPEILAISSELRATQIERKEASDQRLPSVQFIGSYYEQGRVFSQAIPSYTYTGVLSIPIFTGGRISSEVAYARLEEKRVAEQKRETADKVLQQVRTAVENLHASSTAVTVANHALDLAQQEVAQAQRRFAAGVSTNIEVITAQDELARASDNQIDALYRFNQSRADLARATGNAEDVYGR